MNNMYMYISVKQLFKLLKHLCKMYLPLSVLLMILVESTDLYYTGENSLQLKRGPHIYITL